MVLRRLLHLYFLGTRALTLGVRAAILTGDDRFVLVRHSYIAGWHFPGGGLERNEAALDAVRREVVQEIGISLASDPHLFGVYFNRVVSDRDHVLLYLCHSDDALPERPPSYEIADLGRFGLDDLPAGIDPGTERRMREILAGRTRAAEW